MLDKATERGIECVVHDLESFPYPSRVPLASFDFIVCVGVMDFIRSPVAFIKHARGYLKQNARSRLALSLPERHAHSELSSFTRADMEVLFRDAEMYVERHERLVGYTDSQSGQVQMYHVYVCSLATKGSDERRLNNKVHF
jgi:2-polyprenyl-3-methyl-5-hydroxy-6-metoxy-1,4-benzoquinol methylase